MNLYRVLAFMRYILNEIEKLNTEIDYNLDYTDNDNKLRILYIIRNNKIKMLSRTNERLDRNFSKLNDLQVYILSEIQNNTTYQDLYNNGLI